jgi:hypothetical protein
MSNITGYKEVQAKIIELRGLKLILDSDVGALYGVHTREINKAVRNNPDKFPNGYLVELTAKEKSEVVENFHHLTGLKFSKVNPKAFTEKALYMLATILRSPKATEATLAIIEAFTKVREINRTIVDMLKEENDSKRQESLSNNVGKMIGDLIMPAEEDLEIVAVETEAKFKFFTVLEISRKVIKKPKK